MSDNTTSNNTAATGPVFVAKLEKILVDHRTKLRGRLNRSLKNHLADQSEKVATDVTAEVDQTFGLMRKQFEFVERLLIAGVAKIITDNYAAALNEGELRNERLQSSVNMVVERVAEESDRARSAESKERQAGAMLALVTVLVTVFPLLVSDADAGTLRYLNHVVPFAFLGVSVLLISWMFTLSRQRGSAFSGLKSFVERQKTEVEIVGQAREILDVNATRARDEGSVQADGQREALASSFQRFQFKVGTRTWKRADLHDRT